MIRNEFLKGISSSGSMGMANYKGDTGVQFELRQNFPNPHAGSTTIPFTLVAQSEVEIAIYDLSAKRLQNLKLGILSAGDHSFAIDLAQLRIPLGTYQYQIQAINSAGTYRQCKVMTAVS